MKLAKHRRRILFLDTETTGLIAGQDRIIELGILEALNGELTDNYLQIYFNPQVPVNPKALEVHGITSEFLSDKKTFSEHWSEIERFIQGSHEIVMHNANFDVNFLDYELHLMQKKPFCHYCRCIKDNLSFARSLHGRSKKNKLDDLCKEYDVDLTNRSVHGSIVDTNLLAQVYFKMLVKFKEHPLVEQYDRDTRYIKQHETDNLPLSYTRTFQADDFNQSLSRHIKKFTAYSLILDDLKNDFDDIPFFYRDRSKKEDI